MSARKLPRWASTLILMMCALLVTTPVAAYVVPAAQAGFPPPPHNPTDLDPIVVAAAIERVAIAAEFDPADVAATLDPIAVASRLGQVAASAGLDPAEVAAALNQVAAGITPESLGFEPGALNLNLDDPRDMQALTQLGVRPLAACEEGTRQAEEDTNGTLWFLGGCLLTGLAVIGAFVIEPDPPASALVGQDATYVAQYTDCYEDRAQNIQTKNAITGALITVGAYVVLYVALYSLIFASATKM